MGLVAAWGWLVNLIDVLGRLPEGGRGEEGDDEGDEFHGIGIVCSAACSPAPLLRRGNFPSFEGGCSVWGLLADDFEVGLGDDDAGGDGGGILDKIRRCLGVGGLSATVQLPRLLADAAAHAAGARLILVKPTNGVALGFGLAVDIVKADLLGLNLLEGFGVPCHSSILSVGRY